MRSKPGINTNLITSRYSLDLFYNENYIKEASKSYIKQANSIKTFAQTVYKNTLQTQKYLKLNL